MQKYEKLTAEAGTSGYEKPEVLCESFEWERTKPTSRSTVTISGKEVFYDEYNPASRFALEDIAHSLSLQNRFIGHTKHPYSVAQHCLNAVYVAEQVHEAHDAEFLLNVLLHDAAEAYIGDIISPVKQVLYNAVAGGFEELKKVISDGDSCPTYSQLAAHTWLTQARDMEQNIERDIARAFRLKPMTGEQAKLLQIIDSRLCATESHWLCAKQVPDTVEPYASLPEHCFRFMHFEAVKCDFVDMLHRLVVCR